MSDVPFGTDILDAAPSDFPYLLLQLPAGQASTGAAPDRAWPAEDYVRDLPPGEVGGHLRAVLGEKMLEPEVGDNGVGAAVDVEGQAGKDACFWVPWAFFRLASWLNVIVAHL